MGVVSWCPQSDGTIRVSGIHDNKTNKIIERNINKEIKSNGLVIKRTEALLIGGAHEVDILSSHMSLRTRKFLRNTFMVASTCLLAMVIPGNCYATEVTKSLSAVEKLGNSVLSGVQVLGVFIVSVMCLFDALKAIMENDPKRIPGSVVKFAIGLFLIYVVPELFFEMREHFEGVARVNGGPGIFDKAIPVNSGG